jgi:hypothetical protein
MSLTLPGAFTIEAGRAPDPWVDVAGALYRHAASPFTIFYGNRGNVDATAVPLTFAASSAYGLGRRFPITLPPVLPNQIGEGIWEEVGITITVGAPEPEGFTNVPLVLPVIPPGFTGMLRLRLTLPPDPPEGTLFVDIGSPFLAPAPDPEVIAARVQGARDYAASVLGVTIPETLVPDLTQYATAQLEALVRDGRNALTASVGAVSPVYSLAQLQFDLVLFGTARALAQQPSTALLDPRQLLARAGRTFASWSPLFGPAAALAQKQTGGKCAGQVLTESGSCSTRDETISPKAPDNPDCSLQALLKYAENPFSNPRPDCTPTVDDCNAMANHVVRTLPSGGKICEPIGCDQSRPDGYQNTTHCRTFPINPRKSRDPNDKAGSLGVAAAQFVAGDAPFSYVIHFENIDTATGPAAIVLVTDSLDVAHLDLDTFSVGPISFGDFTLVPSPGQSGYSGSVDLRPVENVVVTVDANLDKTTGILTWRFDTIDQATGQSTEDFSVGFLPPNTEPPAGEGLVSFSVRPKAGLATGTDICNQASIVFDQNDPLVTPTWCNTIDVTPPSSQVSALAPTQSSPTFPVQWSGSDAGAGIGDYSLFVSVDGGSYSAILTNTIDTATMFTGEVGKQYAFYTTARDLVGNEESPPGVADATTQITGADQCPTDPNKTEPGVCGCGVSDTDSDSDGTLDCQDACPSDTSKTQPGVCGCGVAETDSDGDGTPDCNESCPNDASKTERGICGCGVADTDSDGDGTADCQDACPNDAAKTIVGICGCGVADTDSDGDGTPNCTDRCPADPAKIAPGVCGCGIPDTACPPPPPADACTITIVLDTFNRADGGVGPNWRGVTGTSFYRVAGDRLDVQLGGPLYWNPAAFGTNQAAFVTLSTVDAKSPSQGVLLKAQSGTVPAAGAIAAVYDAVAKAVRVSTLRLGAPSWTRYGNTPVVFANGDRLGACAQANGEVRVYKNGTLVKTVTLNAADQGFFNAKGGKVGVWAVLAPRAFMDDFGGATITP